GDSACFTATASGWGALTYSWDLDGDGTDDTTTTENTICHKYKEADTYWVKVKIEDEMGCEAEDSVEVIIKKEEYTFDVVMTEEVWEGKDFYPTDWIFDDEGTPWILGYAKEDSNAYYMISDTLGNIDTLYSLEFADVDIPQAPIWIKDRHILHRYFSNIDDTVIYGIDTVVHTRLKFDSLTVTPIFGNGPSWKFIHKFIEPIAIRGNGWAFVKIIQSNEADSVYPGWRYAIAHNGEPDVKIDIEGEVYPDDEYFALNDNKLAVFASNVIGNIYTINVYDTSGALLYSTPELNWCGPACMKFEILSNGSIIHLSGNSNGIQLFRQYYLEIDSFAISDTNYIAVNWAVANNRLFLVYCVINTGGAYRYYFDISDSLALIWDYEITNRCQKSFSILDDNNPCFDITEYLEPNFSWQLNVLSALNGNIIGEWPNTPFVVRRLPFTSVKSNYMLIKDLAEANPPLEPKFLIIRIEGGE
ncbi:hypothetical protein DRQ36_11205, partial [bacterium]